MNILLIRPKSTYADVAAGIPIGLTLLGAVAENKGHRVRILDLGIERDPEPLLRKAFDGESYDIAGISCMSVEFMGGMHTAESIRKLSSRTHIIFGGQHPTIMPEQVMKQEFIDRMAAGDGLEGVPGIWFRKDGVVARNLPRNNYVDVDKAPMPAYHLLDIERYFDLDFVRFP